MSQPKHTLSPWHVLDHPNKEFFVYGPDGNLVANCDGWINHTLADKQANARLIAAAPELLEACKEAKLILCQYIDAFEHKSDKNRFQEKINLLYEAIKKATIDN